MRKQGIIYIILILALWSCREDFERNEAIPQVFMPELLEDYTPAEDMVISSVNGFVMDEDQNPIADVLVTLEGIPTTTDIYGHFFYTDTPMNKEGTVVAFEMADFHQQSKLFYPTEGAVERMDVLLSKIEEETEFNSEQSGSLTLDEGILLDYSTEAFRSSDGSIYVGSVNVSSTFVENGSENFAFQAPGNFQAVNIENRLVGLKAQSLLQISFEDEAGNALVIDQDAEVMVHIPNQNASTTAWYYASNFGLYTINTQTEIDNNTLSVSLSHNTFILLAEPYESTINTFQLSAANGSGALANIQIESFTEDGSVLHSVRSNDEGIAKIIGPINSSSRLIVEDICGNIVYNELQSNVVDDLSIQNVRLKTLEGDVYDCDVSPTNDAVIAIRQGEQIRYHHLENSNFQLSLQICNGGQASIQGLAQETFDASQVTNIRVDMIDELGDIFTCIEPTTNYLLLTNVNTGQEYVYPVESTEGSTSLLTVFGTRDGGPIDIAISITRMENQEFSEGMFSIERIVDPTNGFNYSGDNVDFDLIRFGNRDKISIGTFEGVFENTVTLEMDELRGSFNFYFSE